LTGLEYLAHNRFVQMSSSQPWTLIFSILLSIGAAGPSAALLINNCPLRVVMPC
jgi:hypothetical protein